MNTRASFLIAAGLLYAWQASADRPQAAVTNAPPLTALADQFERPQRLQFPAEEIVLLTIADRKGSDQISPWIISLREKSPERVSVFGIADLSTVPAPLRPTIRRKFQKSSSYPVMLDWSGAAVKSFGYVPTGLEVILLDRTGKIIQRWRGEATARKLEELRRVLDRTLSATNAAPK